MRLEAGGSGSEVETGARGLTGRAEGRVIEDGVDFGRESVLFRIVGWSVEGGVGGEVGGFAGRGGHGDLSDVLIG